MKALATIKGVMLAPGVSKNNRLYTKPAIGRSVQRMAERLADPDGIPIIMRTHHDAGDDSRQIVGRITRVWQETDGSAAYEAKLFDNKAGRDLAPLIAPDENDGKAALRTTSIHGYWVGPVERFKQGGGAVETGDDLEINAVDFTWSPGVKGAQIKSVAFESTAVQWPVEGANVHDGHNIFESMEATISMDEDYNTAQRKAMAKSGQAMSGGSYPIKSKSDLRKAIRAVGRGNAPHAEIRSHIMARAKALGLSNMIPSNWTEGSKETARLPLDPLVEHYIKVCVGDETGNEIEICARNLSPDILRKAIKRAGRVADDIVCGDSDVSAMDDDDLITDPDDIDFEVSVSDASTTPDDTTNYTAGESVADVDSVKEHVVPEINEAAQAAPVGLSETDLTKLAGLFSAGIAEAMKAQADAMASKKAAKKAAKAEAAKNAAESTEATAKTKKAESDGLKETITPAELETKLAEERKNTIAELRESLLKENGIPQRQGYRTVAENDGAVPTGDELWEKRAQVWSDAYPNVFPALT